ncbi:MAG: hypothetical protein WCK43_07790, partial [bacterium]
MKLYKLFFIVILYISPIFAETEFQPIFHNKEFLNPKVSISKDSQKQLEEMQFEADCKEYEAYLIHMKPNRSYCEYGIEEINKSLARKKYWIQQYNQSKDSNSQLINISNANESCKTAIGVYLSIIKALKKADLEWQWELKRNCKIQLPLEKQEHRKLNQTFLQLKTNQEIDRLYPAVSAKEREASLKKQAIVYKLTDKEEVVKGLNEAALLYEEASAKCLVCFNMAVEPKYKMQLKEMLDLLKNKALNCQKEALDWPNQIVIQKQLLYDEISRLQEESACYETKSLERLSLENYRRIELILKELCDVTIESDCQELEVCQSKIIALETIVDGNRLSKPQQIPQESFQEKEKFRQDFFYNIFSDETKSNEIISSIATPLDGQGSLVYAEQFYRYLIEGETYGKILIVKVSTEGNIVHEERIAIPNKDSLFSHLNSVSETILKLKFGLDIRLTIVNNQIQNTFLIIGQKGSNTKFDFSFFLDETPLYDLHFLPPPPWQLDVLCNPTLPAINIFSNNDQMTNDQTMTYAEAASQNVEKLQAPSELVQFVTDMKSDPMAIVQYVYNEIETVDPFLMRENNTFLSAGIRRNPLRTFLEKQGSPWEQCVLLATLLEIAGYQTLYIEGTSSLPSSFVEKLLFVNLPNETETSLKYPGIQLFDGEQGITLFPWMKEIQEIEGYDLYSIMPEDFDNAHLWLKQYLFSDERILKQIGPDGDDTVGVLFVRFVEDELRKKGLSLSDVGTHRSIRKKQYNGWNEFPRPKLHGDFKTSKDISHRNDLFSAFKVILSSQQKPSKKTETNWLNLSLYSCDTFALHFTAEESSHRLHLCPASNWQDVISLLLDASDKTLVVEVLHQARYNQGISRDVFYVAKGTSAALCLQPGSVSSQLTHAYSDRLIASDSPEKKLHALFALIGTAYFEKCSRAEKILTALHKVGNKRIFSTGLAKLSPDPLAPSVLCYPQVDMHHRQETNEHNKD